MFGALSIDVIASTYDLTNLNYIRVNNETIITWNAYTAGSYDEARSNYVIQLSSTEDFSSYVEYTTDLPDMTPLTTYNHSYNLGDTLELYVRLFTETTIETSTPQLDDDGNVIFDDNGNIVYEVIVKVVVSSNTLNLFLGDTNTDPGNADKNYTYYLPHVANNVDFSTYLYIEYDGDEDNELEFVRTDVFDESGFAYTYKEIGSDFIGYLSTINLFNYPVNRESVEIRTVYPINVRVLYVPVNDGHVSGVNAVISGYTSIRISGMYGSDNQINGVAITNLEDSIVRVVARVSYVSGGDDVFRTTTVSFDIPVRSTEVFIISDKFLLPVNYVGTFELQSTGNVAALGVTANNGSLEFTNAYGKTNE